MPLPLRPPRGGSRDPRERRPARKAEAKMTWDPKTRLYLEDRQRLEKLSEKLKLRGSEGPAALENAEVLSLLRMLKYVEDLAEFLAAQEGLIGDRRVSPYYDT